MTPLCVVRPHAAGKAKKARQGKLLTFRRQEFKKKRGKSENSGSDFQAATKKIRAKQEKRKKLDGRMIDILEESESIFCQILRIFLLAGNSVPRLQFD